MPIVHFFRFTLHELKTIRCFMLQMTGCGFLGFHAARGPSRAVIHAIGVQRLDVAAAETPAAVMRVLVIGEALLRLAPA